MSGKLVCDAVFEDHRTGSSHPEGPDRIRVLREGFSSVEHPPWDWVKPAGPLDDGELARVHRSSYVESVRRAADQQRALDADTPVSRESYDVARVAAGSAVWLARRGNEDDEAGFGAVRPPGHHAEPDRGMGFCLFNNIALAADALRREGKRVAIVDVDVHHGNGTQKAFYETDEVLYVSFHQFPFYPGTGQREETGAGDGEGFTVNVPLPAGTGWEGLEDPWRDRIHPALESFDPDHLMVSAGFDAHRADPIGGLNLTDEDFLTLAEDLRTWSREWCEGRLVGLLEGGYNRRVLGRLVPRCVQTLLG